MANKKIVIEGIVTPMIDLGDQSSASAIVYDSGTDTVTINSNLNVTGTTTTVDAATLNIAATTVIVNDGELGAGVAGGTGTAGIQVDRGSLSDALFIFDDNTDAWTAKLVDGTPLAIISNITPTVSTHLTNKGYVDGQITTEIAANIVTALDDVADVNVPTPTSGNSLVWSGTEWNDQLIPPGLSTLTIRSLSNTIDVSPVGAQTGITTFDIDLADTAVTPASYTAADITVDTQGRITAASNGSIFNTISTLPVTTSILSSATSGITVRGNGGIVASAASGILDITLPTTGVSAGTFSVPTVTVDAQGRITAISSAAPDKWHNIATNSGTVVPDGPLDTLTIVGGGGITTSGAAGNDTITVTLPNTGVAAATYTLAGNLQTDAQGRILAISNVASVYVATAGDTMTGNLTQTAQFRGKAGTAASPSYAFSTDTNTGMYSGGNAIILFSTDSVERMRLDSGGMDLTGTLIATGNITAFSDRRLKKNIETIDNALDTVISIRGVSYDRKDTGEHMIGFVAQELEEILPELVIENDDGIKSVAYGNMVALLVEAIKEQQKQIDELKNKLG